MYIVYSCSKSMQPILKASITSLLEHNKPTKIFILTEGDTLPFEVPCKHEIINVSEQKYFPAGGPNMGSIFTYLALMRVCLPEMLKVNKAIVLDVDTIICDSLKPLWDTDLTDKWLAWCPEYRGRWNPYGHAHYYNMGVTVMNLAQMRKDNLTARCVEGLNRTQYRFPEQDLLNKIAVPDMTADIPVRFNESFFCGFTEAPAIVHYAGIIDLYAMNYFRCEHLSHDNLYAVKVAFFTVLVEPDAW